ncbi:hypothetical protein [uncultured Algibacter sp.]|uniref:hypothetical protein n=1 Tax=uncultured Algibacter sp. TaxID=298659 RepID=UPI003216AC0E
MDKKYLNGILILFLVVIWGSLIYKYFGNSTSLDQGVYSENIGVNITKDYGIAKDTFKLKLATRDPFGVSRPYTIKTNTKPSIKKQASAKKPVINKPLAWPTITYHGFVKANNSVTPLILLKINNRVYKKREKDIVNDITLVKSYNDSLIVSLNNNKKTIKRQ